MAQEGSVAEWWWQLPLVILPQLVFPILGDVDQVEEGHAADDNLGVSSDPSLQRETVLVVPPPPSCKIITTQQ